MKKIPRQKLAINGLSRRYLLIAWKGSAGEARQILIREFDDYILDKVEQVAFGLTAEGWYNFEVIDRHEGVVRAFHRNNSENKPYIV